MIGSTDLAARIGCHKSTVNKAAARLSLGSIVGRSLVFTDDEAEAIAADVRSRGGKAGNPNFGKDDYGRS